MDMEAGEKEERKTERPIEAAFKEIAGDLK